MNFSASLKIFFYKGLKIERFILPSLPFMSQITIIYRVFCLLKVQFHLAMGKWCQLKPWSNLTQCSVFDSNFIDADNDSSDATTHLLASFESAHSAPKLPKDCISWFRVVMTSTCNNLS